ncbi:uncharacterized protein LOC111610629 [Xiphophorus maculatus]|uniref:uncharacterized protein LOC111610629 n=1 Tax=Xiphophorus maculatus TaxID=8083 RepID=UPI000C6D6739|nr:uncharacterized protein LOC111610629 [Xiphophorus maculatus]
MHLINQVTSVAARFPPSRFPVKRRSRDGGRTSTWTVLQVSEALMGLKVKPPTSRLQGLPVCGDLSGPAQKNLEVSDWLPAAPGPNIAFKARWFRLAVRLGPLETENMQQTPRIPEPIPQSTRTSFNSSTPGDGARAHPVVLAPLPAARGSIFHAGCHGDGETVRQYRRSGPLGSGLDVPGVRLQATANQREFQVFGFRTCLPDRTGFIPGQNQNTAKVSTPCPNFQGSLGSNVGKTH